MTPVTSVNQLTQLVNSTMVCAIVTSLVALALAWLISSYLIPWGGGHDHSYIKRHIVYPVIDAVIVLGLWIYNDLVVMSHIKNMGFQNMFAACNLRHVGVNLGIYLVVGLVLMFAFRHSRFGSILGKEKK